MDDTQKEAWSRHYDSIHWQVITIFTAGVGALLFYSVTHDEPGKAWVEGLGVGFSILGLFYVASFRSFRINLHNSIVKPDLRAFLKKSAYRRSLKQWPVFTSTFLLIDAIFLYRMHTKLSERWDIYIVVLGILLLIVFWQLFVLGDGTSKPNNETRNDVSVKKKGNKS